MNVSIIICTWNRANLLDRTLTELRAMRIPEGVEWELLVVNNNCTDHTDDVIAKHTSTLRLRHLRELRQGKSHALNCAIDAARGQWIVFTDDDVLVDAEWLAAYCEEMAECDESIAFLGGEIRPGGLNRLPMPISSLRFPQLVMGFVDAPFQMSWRSRLPHIYRWEPTWR